MKLKFKKFLVFLLVLFCLGSFSVFSSRTSKAQNSSADIASLTALVAALQQQLAFLLANQSSICVVLTQNLYAGLDDAVTGGQVSKLQKHLKAQGDYTYPLITGYYGPATQAAVQKFQARMGILSSGTPASNGFGNAGPMTRAKIQALSCSGAGGGSAIALPSTGGVTVSCSASPASIVEGQTATWTASVSGGSGPFTYSWSGTNNLSGTASSVTKKYNSDGTKNATVKVDGVSFDCSPSLTVLPDPNELNISCNVSDESILVGETVTWSSTVSGGTGSYTYVWSGTDSLAGSANSVAKTYTTAGTKSATVTINGYSEDCSDDVVVASPIPPSACNDGIDNDGDSITDYPFDPGCSSATDNDEYNAPPVVNACSDGIDNDSDSFTDYPNDEGCSNASDPDEYNAPPVPKQCSDGIDNDSDGFTDHPSDPGCNNANDNDEYNEPEELDECSDGIDNDDDEMIDYPYEVGCSSPSDDNEDNELLFLVRHAMDDAVWDVNEEGDLGAQVSYLINGLDNDTDDAYANLSQLKTRIEYAIPNPNQSGYAVLDDERLIYEHLVFLEHEDKFENAQAEWIKAVKYAQELRPNIKWGIYGLPAAKTGPYWVAGPSCAHFGKPSGCTLPSWANWTGPLCPELGGPQCSSKAWSQATQKVRDYTLSVMLRPTELFEVVDFMAPTAYAPYEGTDAGSLSHVEYKTKAAVMAANGKPVTPFFSHRLFVDDPLVSLVDPDDQQAHVEEALDAGADGITWWGSDLWGYQQDFCYNKNIEAQAKWNNEFPPGPPPVTYANHAEYFIQLHTQRLKIFAEALYGIDFEPTPIVMTSEGEATCNVSWFKSIFGGLANAFSAVMRWFK
jgi:peptidoglycan hydrolase-like protein with peptidoglycan-binding domain